MMWTLASGFSLLSQLIKLNSSRAYRHILCDSGRRSVCAYAIVRSRYHCTAVDTGSTRARRPAAMGVVKGQDHTSDGSLYYQVEHGRVLSGLPVQMLTSPSSSPPSSSHSPLSSPFVVLGIETSCDDTGVGIVTSEGKILANIVIPQTHIHAHYGGIVPKLAMEGHCSALESAVLEALTEMRRIKSSTTTDATASPNPNPNPNPGLEELMEQIDAIAVTRGPGLELCLRIGCRTAQILAHRFGKPLVHVHHLEAHCQVASIPVPVPTPASASTLPIPSVETRPRPNAAATVDCDPIATSYGPTEHPHPQQQQYPVYPYLAVLVSGGHTMVLRCSGVAQYELVCGTMDDSMGEAFDKLATMLRLNLPRSDVNEERYQGQTFPSHLTGGALIEHLAEVFVQEQGLVMSSPSSPPSSCSSSTWGRTRDKDREGDRVSGDRDQQLPKQLTSSVRSHFRHLLSNNGDNRDKIIDASSAAAAASTYTDQSNDTDAVSRTATASAPTLRLAAEVANWSRAHYRMYAHMKTPLVDKPANLNFSFSGVKNAFRKLIAAEMKLAAAGVAASSVDHHHQHQQQQLPLPVLARICALFQETVFDHLRDKLESVLQHIQKQQQEQQEQQHGSKTGITGIVVVGGVASNLQLRRVLSALGRKYAATATTDADAKAVDQQNQTRSPLPIYFPPVALCTDNGVMVAYSGVQRLLQTRSSDDIGYTGALDSDSDYIDVTAASAHVLETAAVTATPAACNNPSADDNNTTSVDVEKYSFVHPFVDLARARWPLVKSN